MNERDALLNDEMTAGSARKATLDAVAAEKTRVMLILLCVSIPSFMINLDANIVAVSLSSIAESLKAQFAAIEWVISAYTLTFASLLMPAGALADRYGRKRLLLIGLAIFTVASFLCGAAPNVTVLNGARALQGVGAALQLSAALATLSHSFRGPARARAFAFWGSVIGIAIALGPVAGGFITQHFGWQWAFYVNIPVGAVMIVMTAYALDESRDPDATRVDLLGFVTFSSFLFLTTLALISGNTEGWSSRPIVIETGAATVLFGLFIAAERLQQRPMLDLTIFRRPTYIGASVASLAYAAAFLTLLTYLPIYFQNGLEYRPQSAGLLMLPMAVPLFLVPRLVAAELSFRFTGRQLLTAGLILIGAGLSWMALVVPLFSYPAMLGGMLVAGAGAGILNGEIAKVGMSVIAPERAGMASGVSGTLRFSGIVIGFAALGAVLFGRVTAVISAGLPSGLLPQRGALIRSVAAGDLSGTIIGVPSEPNIHALALSGFGAGYQGILVVSAVLATIAAAVTWFLVRAADTPVLVRQAKGSNPYAVAPID